MPFISETASAIKRRFGFHDRAAPESVRSAPGSPDHLLKSVPRGNPSQSLVAASAIRSMNRLDEDDDGVSCAGSAHPSRSRSFDFDEDPSFWKDHNVQVIIRLRPLSSSEVSLQGQNKCVKQESCQTITWTGPPESRFTFDVVADENVSQEKLFNVAGVPMVENCVGGYNSCMFAYGQTGSGKTHTMLGDIEGGTRRHSVNCGMTPRVFEYLFLRIQKEKEARKDEKLRFTCKCSFLEIYNEQILDLLDPSSNNLQLREDIRKGIHVENLKEVEVASARDMMQQLLQGAVNRKVAATNMNRASSRSHSVFTCIIESKWESQGVTHHRFARLNLVDLAGSERQKSSGAEGERLKEATNINKSLSTLGLVIMNLVSISNGKSVHVPYRDSKLTFLLQDSLGGNSKTIIIANISPSTSCSLETLSTLKFAQRAKLIKNNAIINEDASGDVIAMRLQIQQLKKEVSRLRGMSNAGAENQDNDIASTGFPGSPCSAFKWEGLHGSSSPLTSDNRISKGKDYEVALVGAFKREKEKDAALQALAAENQAAMQLTKQREKEIQALKMRLRLRESAVKRLEGVAAGKISAEAHLQKEKDEYLKEIEVLRSLADRNQEVTKFAMENLRLKEEIRRLKSFCEEGERDMMSEQIKVLQNKLLETLDWKLMHESEFPEDCNNSSLLKQKQESVKVSSIDDENEFLRLQAIQNKAEMDYLHKSLSFCLDEKERLEKRVDELIKELEEQKSLSTLKDNIPAAKVCDLSSEISGPDLIDDQMEVKTMVEVIACASQREAEAHERAVKLSGENEDLRLKIKVLIDDNNKLIELYEQVSAAKALEKTETDLKSCEEDQNNKGENGIELRKQVEDMEHQIVEINEENEKLMSLYEKAMQERDEFKRLLSSSSSPSQVTDTKINCPEKLVPTSTDETMMDVDEHSELGEFKRFPSSSSSPSQLGDSEINCSEKLVPTSTDETMMDVDGHSELGEANKENPSGIILESEETSLERETSGFSSRTFLEAIESARLKLITVQQKLSDSGRTISAFSSLEKAVLDINTLSKEIEKSKSSRAEKQNQIGSLAYTCEEIKGRKALADSKLSALKCSLSSFASSVAYFEQREERARMRLIESDSLLNQKKKEIIVLQSCKREMDQALGKIQQSEAELKNNIVLLKIKLEEESKRHEEDKVLFAIDNIEKVKTPQRNCLLSGKATDLLQSEEEKNKLQTEMKLSREKLGSVRKELEHMSKKSVKLETEIQTVEAEIKKCSRSYEELKLALQNVIQEKETLYEMGETGKDEIQSLILEIHRLVFEFDLREQEVMTLEEEMKFEKVKIRELQDRRAKTVEKAREMLEVDTSGSQTAMFMSEKIREETQCALTAVDEAMGLLEIQEM